MRVFGVNTIVYMKMMQEGTGQQELLGHIKENGAEIAEVRREFLNKEELAGIRDEAARLGLTVYYSVPEEIFADGKLNTEILKEVFEEAKLLQTKCVKLSLGNYQNVDSREVRQMAELMKDQPFDVLIENAPQGPAGDADLLEHFFRDQEKAGGKVGLTFDTGNFAAAGFAPETCADQFAPWTRWIHLKDTKNGEVTMLREGEIDFAGVLKSFSKTVPAAIEYPCESLEKVAEEMKKAKTLLEEME